MGWSISTNNKLIMFLLSVLTLLFAIFILFYHVKSSFHVNDLLSSQIPEMRIGSCKFHVLWREYLPSSVNGLTSSPKILYLTERDVYQLYLSQNDEKGG